MFPSKFATWPDDAKWSSSVMSRASKRQRLFSITFEDGQS